MKTFAVTLPDELASFIETALASGGWPSADRLFAYAVTLARTEALLGRTPDAESLPAAPAVPVPKSGPILAVDLTRQNFDSAAFVAGLVDKIHRKKMTQPPGGS